MAVTYCIKVISGTLNDAGNRLSGSRYYRKLASAEKFFVQARTTAPTGTPGSLLVAIDTSNDAINWVQLSIPIFSGVSSSGPTNMFGYELGTSLDVGKFVRVRAQQAFSVGGMYLEVWICGRSSV